MVFLLSRIAIGIPKTIVGCVGRGKGVAKRQCVVKIGTCDGHTPFITDTTQASRLGLREQLQHHRPRNKRLK